MLQDGSCDCRDDGQPCGCGGHDVELWAIHWQGEHLSVDCGMKQIVADFDELSAKYEQALELVERG